MTQTTVEILPPDTPVTTATGRVGIVQEPGDWNAIALPLYRLILLEGLEHPYWFRLQTLKIRAQ
jgi:hypothetical protein